MNLPIALRLLLVDAGLERGVLAGAALRGLFDLAVVERLQRHLALDQLLLEHLHHRLQPLLRRGLELDGSSFSSITLSVPLKSKRVESSRSPGRRRCGSLACRLRRQRRSSARRAPYWASDRTAARLDPGRYPSGQRGRAVNPLCSATLVRIQPGPPGPPLEAGRFAPELTSSPRRRARQ